MQHKFFTAAFFLGLFFIFPQHIHAHHRGQVLGDTTAASELQFPDTVTAGPGVILPDSKLYFLDKFVQGVRLATAFTPERKAQVRTQIAQERLAELRVMMSRNNEKGIDTAINELTKETDAASSALAEGRSKGKDVTETSREINEVVKLQREVLKKLEHQATGSLKLRLKTAREELKESKVGIEDNLTDEEIEREIEDSLHDDLEDSLDDVDDLIINVENDTARMEEKSKKHTDEELRMKEQALQKARLEKDGKLRLEKEKKLMEEKKRIEQLKRAQEAKAKEARESSQKAKEAMKRFEEMKKQEAQFENDDVSNTEGEEAVIEEPLGEEPVL